MWPRLSPASLHDRTHPTRHKNSMPSIKPHAVHLLTHLPSKSSILCGIANTGQQFHQKWDGEGLGAASGKNCPRSEDLQAVAHGHHTEAVPVFQSKRHLRAEEAHAEGKKEGGGEVGGSSAQSRQCRGGCGCGVIATRNMAVESVTVSVHSVESLRIGMWMRMWIWLCVAGVSEDAQLAAQVLVCGAH